MDVELTRVGKHTLTIHSPVMPAAGVFGFGDRYQKLLKIEKFGCFITDPITLHPRRASRGTHVVPLAGGLLLHTGLPNPGASAVVKEYQPVWERCPIPIIAHVIDRSPLDLRRCVRILMDATGIGGFELGVHYEANADEIRVLVETIRQTTELPLLVRVPLERAVEFSLIVARTEAGAVVVGAPPRGVAPDPAGARPLTGRLFGPLVKAQALHAVLQAVRTVEPFGLPVIGCGGIHTPEDAREFIAVGARAVQLDSVIWTRPAQAEIIARDLGGLQLTRAAGSYPDEWFPGIGDTFLKGGTPERPDTLPQ